MSEISKIVKFSLAADYIVKSKEVVELKEDDIIVVQLPKGVTKEEVEVFNEVMKDVSKDVKQKIMILFDPIDVFQMSTEELDKVLNYMKKQEGENKK